MNFLEEFGQFLESKLEDFLKSNPQLNLSIIAQELKLEKEDTKKLILKEQMNLKTIESKILNLSKDIQVWHGRIEKAQQAQRLDLAQEAENRERELLTQGALLWRQMEETKQKITQYQEVLKSLEIKEKEVKEKIDKLNSQNNTNFNYQNYSYNANNNRYDDLEAKFQQWEIDQQLEQLKKNL